MAAHSSPARTSSHATSGLYEKPGLWTTDMVDLSTQFTCAACDVAIDPSTTIYMAHDAKFCSQLCRAMCVRQRHGHSRFEAPTVVQREKTVRSGFAFLGL